MYADRRPRPVSLRRGDAQVRSLRRSLEGTGGPEKRARSLECRNTLRFVRTRSFVFTSIDLSFKHVLVFTQNPGNPGVPMTQRRPARNVAFPSALVKLLETRGNGRRVASSGFDIWHFAESSRPAPPMPLRPSTTPVP